MKSQFNLFGFEIQVTRRDRYIVGFDYQGLYPEDRNLQFGVSFDRWVPFYCSAVFYGWKQARILAKLYGEQVTYVIVENDFEDQGRLKVIRSGTIRIKKTVAFFAR